MKRKQFIKIGSALAWGSALQQLPACDAPAPVVKKNWAGNIEYSTSSIFKPETVDSIKSALSQVNQVTAQGTCHCFNRIADSPDHLMDMKPWNRILDLNKERFRVTVQAGTKYGELAPVLHQQGFALHNLASLPHISVAGSIATATHGSGIANGNLATAVTELELVNGSGNVLQLTREKDRDLFNGAVVALGALGIVTKVTLELQPTYSVSQWVFEKLPVEELYRNFEPIMGSGYSVSLFTDWQSDSINEVWVKAKTNDAGPVLSDGAFFGAVPATRDMHPIAINSAENCTPQMGVPGPWHERLPHFKMGFTPSSGVELQAEYFVSFEDAVAAIKAVSTLSREIGPHLFISEIRSIAADNLWLSTAYHRKSVAIHFTWKQENDAVMQLLPKIEKVLEPFAPRPHWGKLFTIPKEVLEKRYERMNDFRNIAKQFDPQRKFVNPFLSTHVL